MWFYINGSFVEDEHAKVSVQDRAFLYGDGCFESLGIWDGRVLHLDESMARLGRSTRMLRIASPPAAELVEVVLETAARNRMSEVQYGYLRVQVTRGVGMSVASADRERPPTVVVIPRLEGLGEPRTLKPRSAVASSYVRASAAAIDPRIKSLDYTTSVLAYLEAAERGADIAVLRDDRGFVAEGQTMNLFCVRDGVVRTSPEASALAGITRAHLLDASRRRGYPCLETPLTMYDLECADEVFATSSMQGVMPVGAVGGLDLPIPAPGPVTRDVHGAYVEKALSTGTPVPALS